LLRLWQLAYVLAAGIVQQGLPLGYPAERPAPPAAMKHETPIPVRFLRLGQ
jgi:hypothetical protein